MNILEHFDFLLFVSPLNYRRESMTLQKNILNQEHLEPIAFNQ